MLIIIAVAVGLFFAMNIGASGAAASMGISYGSGVIKRPLIALCLCGIAVFFGAWLGGGEVVKTLGNGIVPKETFTISIALIVLASAAMSLFLANILAIPLSTSEVTVGSIVGAGIVYQSLYVAQFAWIFMFWILTPLVAFTIAVLAGKFLKRPFISKWVRSKKAKPILAVLVVLMGVFEAFSAGMNNVANAVGPLVGADILSTQSGIFWGGLFVAIGAVLLGRGVLETNGKKITELRIEEGCIISGTGAGLVMAASIFGIPVPLVQITTSSIIGIGFAKQGKAVLKKDIVIKLLAVWIVSPVLSMVLCFTLIQLLIEQNMYLIVVMAGLLISVFGVKYLMKKKPEETGEVWLTKQN